MEKLKYCKTIVINASGMCKYIGASKMTWFPGFALGNPEARFLYWLPLWPVFVLENFSKILLSCLVSHILIISILSDCNKMEILALHSSLSAKIYILACNQLLRWFTPFYAMLYLFQDTSVWWLMIRALLALHWEKGQKIHRKWSI